MLIPYLLFAVFYKPVIVPTAIDLGYNPEYEIYLRVREQFVL